jgi:methyl coenzyme M reductase beta subunit
LKQAEITNKILSHEEIKSVGSNIISLLNEDQIQLMFSTLNIEKKITDVVFDEDQRKKVSKDIANIKNRFLEQGCFKVKQLIQDKILKLQRDDSYFIIPFDNN